MKVSKGYRTLFITQLCPYPARGGGAMRVWQNLNILAQSGEVVLFSIFKGPHPRTILNRINNLPTLRQTQGKLPPPPVWLRHSASAQSSRAHTEAHLPTWHHYDIGAPQRSRREKIVRRLGWLRPDGHPRADWLYTRQAAQQLKDVIQQFRPTLIICAEIWLYRYLPILRSARCPVILDNHNVEGDAKRFQATQNTLSKIRHIERHWLQHADQVWTCSQTDRDLLEQLYPQTSTSLQIIPNGVDPTFYTTLKTNPTDPTSLPATRYPLPATPPPSSPPPSPPAFLGNETLAPTIASPSPLSPDWAGTRPAPPPPPLTLLFPGRFSYPPNAEAAAVLINHIYPALKQQVSDCQLLLVGIDPTPQMISAAADPDIIVTGEVDDVRPYLAMECIMVVPLQSGSGTRLKLLEAFAAGCPVVSTPKGAEGLAVQDGQQLYLRSTPAAIVEAVLELWHNPDRGQQLAKNAYACLLQHYAWSAVANRIEEALAGLP
ncbi:MAG: glycosyltransferase family 4 protein [Cyanobacteria bacterium P01_G01_bin.38]